MGFRLASNKASKLLAFVRLVGRLDTDTIDNDGEDDIDETGGPE